MNQAALEHYKTQVADIRQAGLYKAERIMASPQRAKVRLTDGTELINMCANNYLGLSDDQELIAVAKQAYDERGFGLSSVRFICGTQDIHKQLERKISQFLQTEDTILYSSCYDANGGLFETILSEQDAVISDALNHASIIDGIRLCKAQRYRYANNDMGDLRQKLMEADQAGARIKLIATDGVFSMDGIIANLKAICDLADEFNALVMVDDSHATGFVGATGRGSAEHNQVLGRVDIITSTLGKALGGASGGFASGRREIVELLRQRSRPYLFSNSVAPSIVGAAIKVFDRLMADTSLRDQLADRTQYYRERIQAAGFEIIEGSHPIVPIMLYDEHKAAQMAEAMLDKGIYVVAFSYPVVPKGKARIRTQVSAALTEAEIDRIVAAFIEVKQELKI